RKTAASPQRSGTTRGPRPRRRGNNMRRLTALLIALLMTSSAAFAQGAPKAKRSASTTKAETMAGNIVSMPSPSPLYQIQIMVLAGSGNDPAGKEGTASLVGDALIEGGFGSAKAPVTKEKLAEITRPRGDAARPKVRVDKQATTISVLVPKEN